MTHWPDILESDEGGGGCVEKEGEIGHEDGVVRERENERKREGERERERG